MLNKNILLIFFILIINNGYKSFAGDTFSGDTFSGDTFPGDTLYGESIIEKTNIKKTLMGEPIIGETPLEVIESGTVSPEQNITMSFFIVERMDSRGDINRTSVQRESNDQDQTLQDFSIILPKNASNTEMASITGVLNLGGDVWTFINESILNLNSGRLVVNTKLSVKDKGKGDTKLISKEPFDTIKVVGNTEQRVTDFIDVGVILSVSHVVIDENTVQAEISVSISEVLKEPDQGRGTTVPVISTRDVNTMIDLEVNQLNILSELTVDKKINTESGVPYLRNIPFLGKVFFTSKKETVARTKLYIVGGVNTGNKKRIEAYNSLKKENESIIKGTNFR